MIKLPHDDAEDVGGASCQKEQKLEYVLNGQALFEEKGLS